jgi:hypothetical protein
MVHARTRGNRSRRLVLAISATLAVSAMFPMTVAASEGCTPGYWKQPQHFGDWPAIVGTQTTQLKDVTAAGGTASFVANPLSDMTLLAILEQGGGGLKALGRHTVAALLNAGSTAVDYSPSRAMIINWFNEAYLTGTVEALKDRLEAENESGCPL